MHRTRLITVCMAKALCHKADKTKTVEWMISLAGCWADGHKLVCAFRFMMGRYFETTSTSGKAPNNVMERQAQALLNKQGKDKSRE